MDKMKIEWVSIKDIKPYENNAKIHSKRQIEKIAKSIEQFGFKQNLVIDSDGVIVVGHGRYEAAKLLGLDEVPCVRADDLTEDELRLYRIVDNRISSVEYDSNIEFSELSEINLDFEDFDLELFNMDEIEEVDGYDEHNDDREFFSAAFTFPIGKREQILKYLRKHKNEITEEIIEKASE